MTFHFQKVPATILGGNVNFCEGDVLRVLGLGSYKKDRVFFSKNMLASFAMWFAMVCIFLRWPLEVLRRSQANLTLHCTIFDCARRVDVETCSDLNTTAGQ